MRLRVPSRILRTSAGVCAVAVLLLPVATRAYTTAGYSLGLSQRDVRLFDNFTNPGANDNTTPDPNWPGYTGAELAVWKAVCEWGSELHGDGSGDPLQPGDLGSGGANFDVTWQGNAPNPGSATSNVIALTAGCGAGVIAYGEYGPNGWRIHLCNGWQWDDGPGDPTAGVDIQAVVTHEYGHALGLGHSSVVGATMYAGTSGNGVNVRSIEADDRAGLQAIYGAMSASKPHIDAINGSSALTIVGKSFGASANEVWFTQGGGNPTGEPVKVTGVASTQNGTVISVLAPVTAGPGDVLVLSPGVGGGALSNAFPWGPSRCPAPADYCVGKPNSQGCTPKIDFVGTPSASNATPFLITAGEALNNKTGFLVYGFAPASTPFMGGTLCFAGTLKRTPAQGSGGNPPPNDCSGSYVLDFNARIQSGIDANLVVGKNVYAQYYMRDPGASFGVGLSDALAFTICP